MIRIDWKNFHRDHIWFGMYFLPGLDWYGMLHGIDAVDGHWYRSPVLKWYQIFAPRTGYNMYGSGWDK